MARSYKGNYFSSGVAEKALLIIYALILLYLLFTKDSSLGHWIIIIFITIVFIVLLIGIKIYRSINWIITHSIEGFFFSILYKIGLGKYVAKMINIVNEEKENDDNDYKNYKLYWERKKVFRRILNQKQRVNLLLDIGGDSLYIFRHYIHQKKESLAQQNNLITLKRLVDLSGSDFENLLYRLFVSMGYAVQKIGNTTDQSCELIINLKEQKLFVQAIRHKESPITNSDIQEVLAAQKLYKCNGTIIISGSNFTNSAIEVAKAYHVGLVSKERISELLLLYLKENWL